ncbi:adenosylcobinamide-phosphate synthase CbiB [Geopsychrobacter electrodiphilus]|uniref:adenosylcobinamide-phosphate synthase CbiB n=1 Tax=Geopsychrobacter electrodiphilus TaxID=225196 RepID=UPI000374B95E|nr:adenosylcobinamide-phosphate synthase CbiB [Geopsychrobacter electrodiphilus]
MSAELLVAAVVLDLLFADPRHWPHPVVWIGRLITGLEDELRQRVRHESLAGLLLVLSVLGIVGFAVISALQIAGAIAGLFQSLLALWLAASCLALRGLHLESLPVIEALKEGDVGGARQALAMIVGRETAQLDEAGILRATVETLAENASDGVIAPLFYLCLGGPVAALLYKAVNTMDSMVGYKNERYLHFGRSAAQLDDLLNWIPARLTGLLLVGAAWLTGLNGSGAWRIMWRDARKHASPNAGWPEAAAAGALNLQLGGAAVYFGAQIEKPTLGDASEAITIGHYQSMIRLLYTSAFLGLLPAVLLLGVFS